MSSINLASIPRPQAVAFVILGLAAGVVWTQHLAEPTDASMPVRQALPTDAVPAAMGEWVGTPIALDQRVFEILETRDVASMEYRRGEEPSVWLAQVAGFGTRAAFHPPEICYVGSRFEVLERGPVAVAIHDRPQRLMRLVLGQGDRRFEAWYWFTAGRRVTPNYYQQQLWLLADAIAGKSMSGTLVRISTSLDDPDRAQSRLRAFVEALEAARRPAPAQQYGTGPLG